MGDPSSPSPVEIDETLPDLVKEFLRKGYTLEQITLHAEGYWTHKGQRFENDRIVALFNRSVDRTEGGTWVIDVGMFVYPIEVEDCGFFVEHIQRADDAITLHLSDGRTQTLDPHTLSYEPEGRLYCEIRQGAFKARFKRAPYHALSDHFEQEGQTIFFAYAGAKIPLMHGAPAL